MADLWTDGIRAGSTSVSHMIVLRDKTTGLGETGVAFGSVTASYRRKGGTRQVITLSALTNIDDAYSSGGWKEDVGGAYRIDLPDAMVASGAPWVALYVTVAGTTLEYHERIPLPTRATDEVYTEITDGAHGLAAIAAFVDTVETSLTTLLSRNNPLSASGIRDALFAFDFTSAPSYLNQVGGLAFGMFAGAGTLPDQTGMAAGHVKLPASVTKDVSNFIFVEQTPAGQWKVDTITSYNTSTQDATMEDTSYVGTQNSLVAILPDQAGGGASLTAAEIWNYLLTNISTSGSIGVHLKNNITGVVALGSQVPTAVQNRQEMDSNSTVFNTILTRLSDARATLLDKLSFLTEDVAGLSHLNSADIDAAIASGVLAVLTDYGTAKTTGQLTTAQVNTEVTNVNKSMMLDRLVQKALTASPAVAIVAGSVIGRMLAKTADPNDYDESTMSMQAIAEVGGSSGAPSASQNAAAVQAAIERAGGMLEITKNNTADIKGSGFVSTDSLHDVKSAFSDATVLGAFADKFLNRRLGGGADGGRNVSSALRSDRGKVVVDFTNHIMTVYLEDGNTIDYIADIVADSRGRITSIAPRT